MPVISPQKLISLQKTADNIRNICILAHVDHGKTSLSDALLATNGIVSPKLAGKVRYLDSRPDEQLRGITMESSAISLYFSMLRRSAEDSSEAKTQEYLINLIDSPGHIDFQSEVSTASRLCDGAVVLVDAVEGVCSQTVTVLRQTWVEKLKPILVINKMDRLITELKMKPLEANIHLSQLLEQVNAVMGSFFQGERMEEDLRWREKMEERASAAAAKAQERDALISDAASQGLGSEYEERDDEDIYFAPEKNNVIFSSAIDGWAFTVKQFASLYEKKLGIKRSVLEKVLWGEFYMDPKTKRILGAKHLKGRNLKPMFVQLVLDQIWAVYQATVGGANGKGDEALLAKISTSLGITIPAYILKSRDSHNILTTLVSKWLPLSTALLVSVVEQLPSPPASQAARMPALLDSTPSPESIGADIRAASTQFTQSLDAPQLAFVSKMVSVKESELPRNRRVVGKSMTAEEARELARKKRAEIAAAQASADGGGVGGLTNALGSTNLDDNAKEAENEDPEHLIGFARLYSGTLRTGDQVYVIPPKYSPANPEHPPAIPVKVEALYMLMGRALEALDEVPAGCIFGISGLESALLKQGTLCSSARGAPNLAGLASTQAAPIVRVALEPQDPRDLSKMIEGLKMLERADPCAVYEVLPETGEHVLGTAGELHLERCLKDLRERFARCEVQVGEPIVPYREGIVDQPSMVGDVAVGPRGTADVQVSSKGAGTIRIRLRVRPLPVPVMDFLIGNGAAVKNLVAEQQQQQANAAHDDDHHVHAVGDTSTMGRAMTSDELRSGLREAFKEASNWNADDFVDHIIAFGPRRLGPNVLLDSTPEHQLAKPVFKAGHQQSAGLTGSIGDKIVQAFQLATQQGPLCHEPVQGVCVAIQSLTCEAEGEGEGEGNSDVNVNVPLLTPPLLRALRAATHAALLESSPRLYLATLLCTIAVSEASLGRVYDVLAKRRAHVLSEALSERTNSYAISSLLALRESFGFADEIRKRTSGAATVELAFRGFENLEDEDPFWVPRTEEELEDLGDTADRDNRARVLVDEVRRRKGMLVAGKKGLDAEKERNLKR